jgi:hypothetical protein
MTGSGKTGLCLALLEEAGMDQIPVIAIDPKGDIGNLLLTFPDLCAQSLQPWVDPEQARRLNMTTEEFAREQSEIWHKGLVESGQSTQRIATLREKVALSIYTPGSTAGVPLSMLKSFSPPQNTDDAEVLKDKLQNAVMAVLSMAGIKADPFRSREYILLASILETFWRAGSEVSLASLVQAVPKPPIQQVGAFDLESFYPAKERFELAMALNNLLASPGFEVWAQGEPLAIDRLLYTDKSTPRISIISIAHLNDTERMFVTTLVLNELVAWMRNQRGTTSLRALLYMDELYGYLPPVENPPSKRPLLTLLKQARAFGLGVVLSTQNPVDLDYKALSNAGTWFIGRLQTERDKKRLLDGLEEATTASGTALNRAQAENILSDLGNRVFLVHNVHDKEGSQVLQTRWAMSYLRGPLTRSEIKELVHAETFSPGESSRRATAGGTNIDTAGGTTIEAAAATTPGSTIGAPSATKSGASPAFKPLIRPAGSTPPVVPPEITQYFLPVAANQAGITYSPQLIASARVHYTDARAKIDLAEDVSVLVPFLESGALPLDWQMAAKTGISPKELLTKPQTEGRFAGPPPSALQAKNYSKWSKDFVAWIVENCRATAYRHRDTKLKLISEPGEDEKTFKLRVRQKLRELRDKAADELHKRYATKLATLRDRQMRAQQAVERESMQTQQAQWQSAVDVGAGLLGAFMGSRRGYSASVRRAAGGASKAARQQQDLEHAQASLTSTQQQLADLEAQFSQEMDALEAKHESANAIETVEVCPKKTGISVELIALVWSPESNADEVTPIVANSRSQ